MAHQRHPHQRNRSCASFGAGRSFADLLEAYPKLTENDLRSALTFAADYMEHETVFAIAELRARLEQRPGVTLTMEPAQAVRAERDGNDRR